MASEDRLRESTWLAFQINRMHCESRSKKGMKPLNAYLKEIGSKTAKGERQSPDQVASVLSVISGQFGIPLRKKKSRKKAK